MSNTVYEVDFTRALPAPLKNDEKMLALGRTIAGELQETIRLARLTIIYARIDELDEWLLDILARDLHVDCYEDSHPIEAKRQVIKDSVRVHKRLGTRFAIVTALGSVFPHTEVQEWYEYGGTHHRFRILLDMSNANAPADFYEILRAVQFYKRLTAHLDEIIYQMSAVIEVSIETTVYRQRHGMTGKYRAGTEPRRNTRGALMDAVVTVKPDGIGAKHQTPYTGTKPHRSTVAALRELDIITDNEAQGFNKRFGMTGRYNAGTEPNRTTGGGVASGVVEVAPDGSGTKHQTPRTGTKPDRSTQFASRNNDILADTAAEGFTHTVKMTGKATAGTIPPRDTSFIFTDNDVFADTDAEAFLFTVNMTGETNTGTQPRRNIIKGEKAGALSSVITVDSFFYHVRRCGTSRTKNI